MQKRFYRKAVCIAALVVAIPSLGLAANPKTAPNETWISLSGTVVSTTPDSFRLDYSKGVITVEMDDFDFYEEGRNLMENDQVVVHGRIDDDFFEKRTIEAASVYVENLQTHFYASAADEEDFATWTATTPILVGRVEVTGTVTSKKGREFTLDTGLRRITVDTDALPYNPMDDTGFLQIDVGDAVKVAGNAQTTLFHGRQIEADWIIEFNR